MEVKIDMSAEQVLNVKPLQEMKQNGKSCRMSILDAKGLLNMPGQNNCFLNSAVQVLWHLDIFRRSFRELSGHACMADSCIFCALKELFNQFQYSQESALPPDALRFALAEAFSDQRRFQLGFMDDAAECFENILLRIHCHIANKDSEDMCNVSTCLPHCISHQKFAMNLIEQIVCHSCGATSEPFPFTQMVHYVSTPALCSQAKQSDRQNGTTFGELLKSAGALGDVRNCPRSCGAKIQIKKTLINRPDIVSIGLVWDSERPTINQIIDIFRAIGTALRLPDVFDLIDDCRESIPAALQLVGLVTYYGKHYSTFFFHTKLREWVYFDDATVKAIGPHWEQVIDKCIRGHFQPLLLLYANPNGTPVNTENAPKDITPLVVNKHIRRSYMSPLQANCDANSKFNLNANANMHNKSRITSDTEANVRTVMSHINKNSIRQLNLQKQANIMSQMNNWQTNNIYQNINYYTLPSVHCNPVSKYEPNDALHKPLPDVPDSPSAHSSASYFSDIGEIDSGYISRKTVESILNMQRHKKAGNRNSSSSLESFDMRNGNVFSNKLPNDKPLICTLKRNDSGNSSGERNSGSSASVSSVESPYYSFLSANRKIFSNVPNHRHPSSPQIVSDAGYDSFSLSSTDSFPSVGGPSSPGKLNSRLTQIPEDVQLMELINTSTMLDCDKLCSEADILLLKSHEKEREGDLRAAAALSDSAASKARTAMDAPYSNHQTLITAKMKHSMCVMRSASLHKRLKEIESEEKRRIKAEQTVGEYHHSRQSSRDSTHSKHSRQGSKDSKDSKSKESNTKHASLEINKNRANEGGMSINTLEIYATLPKKGSKKKLFRQSLSSLSSLRIKSDDGNANLNKDTLIKRGSAPNVTEAPNPKTKSQHSIKKTCDTESAANSNDKVVTNKTKIVKIENLKSARESDIASDYYSEWEATRRTVQPIQRTLSGSASCKENDSEYYGEIGEFSTPSSVKKQHRVKKKLLMGGFMKRKNRSLPDLREGVKANANEQTDAQTETAHDDSSCGKSIAQISSKGFHQPHRAFISEHGLYTQRPALLKVSPPLIEAKNRPNQTPQHCNKKLMTNSKMQLQSHLQSNTSTFSQSDHLPRAPTPPKSKCTHIASQTTTLISAQSDCYNNSSNNKPKGDNFLRELTTKRAEILKSNIVKTQDNTDNGCDKVINVNANIKTHNIPSNKAVNDGSNYESIACIAPHLNDSMRAKDNSKHSSQHNSQTVSQTKSTSSDANIRNTVKDLASKFEKVMFKSENKQNLINEKLNEVKDMISEAMPSKTGGLLSMSNGNVEEVKAPSKTVMCSNEANSKPIPNSILNIPSPIQCANPMITNCLSPSIRPNKPPDYQTAIKRLGMLRNERINMSNIPLTRPLYMNLNAVQQRCPLPPPPSPHSLQMLLTHNQTPLSESPKYTSIDNQSSVTSPQSTPLNSIIQQTDDKLIPHFQNHKKKNGFKKSVSFSDQVVLVACADDEEQEFIPNPLLERILSKNNGQQSI